MCQLTWMNLPKSFLYTGLALQLVTNANRNNRDGWGIFTEQTGIVKSAEPASYKLGATLAKENLSTPALGHVRLKSAAYRLLPVDITNSHPFEKKNIVLAHNGTLSSDIFLDEKKIDSEIFADALDEYLEKNKESVEVALPKIMADFEGKFAFIIYDKRNKVWYAARGNSADLHVAYISLNGRNYYVVNTDKDTLDMFCASYFLIAGSQGNAIYLRKDIALLPQESIFRLERDEVKKVGEIKENYPKVIVDTHVHRGGKIVDQLNDAWLNNRGGSRAADERFQSLPLPRLGELGLVDGVSYKELDQMFYLCVGKLMIECKAAEVKEVLRIISEILKPHLTMQKIQLVKNLKDLGTISEASLIVDKMPLIMNTSEELKNARKELYKIKHAGREE